MNCVGNDRLWPGYNRIQADKLIQGEAILLKKIIVIGDRVLIRPDEGEERTKVGLYLPQTVKEKEEVAGGTIVLTGPGIPLVDPSALGEEPWRRASANQLQYLPMEARPGDFALFLRKASVEIKYEGEKYLIVPQSAILVLIREEDQETGEEPGLSDFGL